MSQGERWGSYLLEERVGSGGMAEVFRARRVGAAAFSKVVCVKRLHAHLTSDKTLVELFLDEARTGAKLRHKNIVGIDDLGEHEGRFFLAMEFVNGVNLAELEGRARASGALVAVEAVAYLAGELLAALHAAHTALDPDDGRPLRVVHRDVSPHNVLVSYAGEVKLADFGIARAERRVSVTSEATVRGRFGYMPVEQASGRPLDARADLFALGVVLFELLTGRRPFRGEDPEAPMEAILVAQLTNERPSLVSLRGDVPAELAHLIEWLLATEVSQRPSSAAEALAHLEVLPARLTGGTALAALMGALYPSFASTAQAPRASWSGPRASVPSAAVLPADTQAPWVTGSASAAAGVAPVDPYATTDRKRDPELARATDAERDAAFRRAWRVLLVGTAVVATTMVALWWFAVRAPRTPVPPARVVLADTTALPSASAPAMASVAPVREVLASAAPSVAPGAARAVPSVTPSARTAAVRLASAPAPTATPRATSAPAVTAAPPAASAEQPSAEAPPALGTLRVIATPWGEVFVDGQPRGRAPIDERVGAGEHDVRVTGGVEHRERVRVSAGHATVVRAGREEE